MSGGRDGDLPRDARDLPPERIDFLRVGSYRRRRMSDALHLLPVLGAALFAIPLLWSGDGAGMSTGRALVYVFVTWAALILLGAVLSARMARGPEPTSEDDAQSEAPDRRT